MEHCNGRYDTLLAVVLWSVLLLTYTRPGQMCCDERWWWDGHICKLHLSSPSDSLFIFRKVSLLYVNLLTLLYQAASYRVSFMHLFMPWASSCLMKITWSLPSFSALNLQKNTITHLKYCDMEIARYAGFHACFFYYWGDKGTGASLQRRSHWPKRGKALLLTDSLRWNLQISLTDHFPYDLLRLVSFPDPSCQDQAYHSACLGPKNNVLLKHFSLLTWLRQVLWDIS